MGLAQEGETTVNINVRFDRGALLRFASATQDLARAFEVAGRIAALKVELAASDARIAEIERVLAQQQAELAQLRREILVRRLLGYLHDDTAPGWVRRLHEQQIAQFGTGNGRQ